jgi:hypothetical protein
MWSGRSDHKRVAIADPNGVAGVQLSAPAHLGLVVDQDPLGGEEHLDLATAADDPGELQQLAEPDHLALDWDLTGHPTNLELREETHDILRLGL